MLGIIGTIPENCFPQTTGQAFVQGKELIIDQKRIPINRGTPAMVAAAAETLEYLGKPAPFCYLAGDIGDGKGCKLLYEYLEANLAASTFKVLTFHYFQPDVVLFKKVLKKLDSIKDRPLMIADAGFMYVAKMGGDSKHFDLFTPDAGELAYLADEQAPHPFYTRGFILHEDNQVPELIKRAYKHDNAAAYLLVKGAKDYLANREGIINTVDSPSVEELEAIGGTGDTLTGIVSALMASGMEITTAASKASKINRLAGAYSDPTPATQIYEIIKQIPRALKEVL